ncbi:MAG: serine O-acetyltransferase, partial [Pseudomonadota bacterium]
MQKAEKAVLKSIDPVWQQMRSEAQTLVDAEPALAAFVFANLLSHDTLEQAIIHRVGSWLDHPDLPADLTRRLYTSALQQKPALGLIFRADLSAVIERDPACYRLIEPFLYFKGFVALQAQRLAHALWLEKRKDLAMMIQSRMAATMNVDIHPGAKIGRGIMLDHATGCVFGETVVIEDNVSILHDVTLGGSTNVKGADRHPKIRSGVLIGAGAKILGAIEIG